MIIYGAILIPILSSIVLLILFKKKLVWWELVLPIVVSVILVIISKLVIEKAQVSCEEYLGSMVTKVDYYEPWDEYIHRTCTRTVGSGKNSYTESYDCSYVENHPAKYVVSNLENEEIYVDKKQYLELKNKFGNSFFTDLHRDYYSKDGDKYTSTWDQSQEKAEPFFKSHTYENRVKAADQSIFHYEKVDTLTQHTYQLKDYPEIIDNYRMRSILVNNKEGYNKDSLLYLNEYLNYFNGILGKKKQVHIFILIFQNQPIEAAFYQENYWSGGNKNEVVVCIDIDNSSKVKWAKVFSWTKREDLKSDIKSMIESQDKLNLRFSIKSIADLVNLKFERRHFKEFNYLSVEPPLWTVILVYCLVILVNIGIGYWSVTNEYNEEK